MYPVQNTFIEIRPRLQELTEIAKRSSVPPSFAPVCFPPPTPFVYRPSCALSRQGHFSVSPTSASVKPTIVYSSSRLSLPPPTSAAASSVPDPGYTKLNPSAGFSAVLDAGPRPSNTESLSFGPTGTPAQKRKSLGDCGWEAVVIHSEAFKDGTARVRANLSHPPFSMSTRCYKSAQAFLRAFDKKREPHKALLFVEASEAAGVLTWVHVRRFGQILHVIVIGPPRAGGDHAAEAAAFVRSLDDVLHEAALIAFQESK